MLNIMSYVGMSLQAEVCMWTLLGLMRTIFDATLFKVNANLKQVWQMKMPSQLSMTVQRMLRTMVSGVMLVQCFTLSVYLAVYIVMLYPVFLEERPTLVLPWLLLAAIRKLLCELTSLALGLGTCVLLGPARSPCVRFLIIKVMTITPAFYMWILVLSYYHTLKMAATFKTFPAVVAPVDRDFGLELAVRRRRTKSLFGEDQLRRIIIAGLYGERASITKPHSPTILKFDETPHAIHSNDSIEGTEDESYILRPLSVTSDRTLSEIATFEDCLCREVVVPRDTDRILEQLVTMSLRISTYLKRDGTNSSKYLDSFPTMGQKNAMSIDCNTLSSENTEPSHLVGSSKGKVASYLTNYPKIFMKKTSEIAQHSNPDLNEIAGKETDNKAVGGMDTLYCDKSIICLEKSVFTEKNTNNDGRELSNIFSIKTNLSKEKSDDNSVKTDLQAKKLIISFSINSEPEQSFEYIFTKPESQLPEEEYKSEKR